MRLVHITNGDSQADDVIVFIHGALLTYKIMTMFEPYFRDYKLIFINQVVVEVQI